MKSKIRKQFRTFLFKEKLNSGIFSSKKNLFKKSQNIKTYSSFVNSRSKENKTISLYSINKHKNMTIFSTKNSKILKLKQYEDLEKPKYPQTDNFTTKNNIENNNNKSFHLYCGYNCKINNNSQNRRYLTTEKKSKFNSFSSIKPEVNKKMNTPKYIRLSHIFDNNLKSNLFSINKTKLNIKEKSFKLKLGSTKEYKDYIFNRMKNNYNKNYDSIYIHKLKSEFMIKDIEKKNNIILNKAKKYKYTHMKEELKIEEKDKVSEQNLGKLKMFSQMRKYLINQYQNHIIGKDAKNFYSKKENRINFLYDIYLLPNLKNNLIKQNFNVKELEQINFIDHNTLRFLNIAKIKIQKHKDNLNTSEFIEEQINNVKMDDFDLELDKTYREKYDLYDMEDYINKKKINQSEVKIFNEKNKFYFYNTYMKIHDKNNLKNIY